MAKNNNTLVFNGLMQGMSWNQIKEAKEEIQRHQGEKQPTRKDILTNWIIGKDYMLQQQGNTFDSGGFAGIDWKSGNFKYTGENGEPVVGNTNWLGAASSALQLVGDAFSGYNNIENKKDEFNTQLNQFQNQRFNIGDNAFLTSEWDNRMLLGDAPTREQFGYKNGWKVGLSALQNGLTTAATTGNIWLGAGMAVADIAKNIGLNLKAESAQDEALKRYNIAQGQQPELFNYSANLAQITNAFNQRQNMAKNGGKLKKSHKFAEGGLLNTYDYGLEEVNAGGSHEENPNEGVVVSYAPDGLPNKVEEGETIHNDYVYSKRLEANEKVLKNNLLDEKYKGKSFADISKKLTEDRKKRPNDSISVRTNEENLNRLQNAQEELKLDNKTREVKRFLGSLNNDQLNALQQEMMDEYEAYAEQQAQQQEQEDQAYQEEQAAQEGMFGRGGHLKQNGSLISATEPVYDAEGKIVGWKQPETTTENVLNLSDYNPNYEGAQIYADNRNWFQRNITSPWNTWWNNLPSPEFSWAVRNLTPVGAIDAIINGDTERLLAAANTGGPVQRNIFDDFEGKGLAKSLQQDRAIDKMQKNAYEELVSSKAPSKTSTPKTATRKPKKAPAQQKQPSQEVNNTTSNNVTEETRKAKFLRRLKNLGITAGVTTGIGAAVNLGVKESERQKTIKDIYDSEIPIQESDSVKVPYSNTNNYIYSPDSSYWYDPVEGRMFYKKSEGGRLFQSGGFAPYEFEEVNGEVFAHRNIDRNGNIVTLTIPEAEFTPDMVTAYGIWKQRNNSNISTKNTPVKPKYASTTKPTTTSPIVQETPNNNIQSTINNTEVSSNNSIYDSFKTIFGPYIQNSLTGPKPYVEEEPANNPNPNIKPKPEPELGQKDSSNYLSYLRYAPILGSLGQVLSDTLGLSNQPDYSNIDMYRRAVDSIGGVNFVPIGGYQQYTPIDREYIANQQLAQASSYNRSLNNANPVGSYILGLINDAKVRDQIGDMYINAAAQDQKDRLAVAEYNRGIDITNARNSLAAQSENARLRAQRANEYQSIANMMNTERNTAEAARAANYQGLFTNIGNLGTDEMNRTMVNRNPALFYGMNRDGSIYFKNAFWGLSEDTQNELIDMLEKQGYKISK